MFYYKCMRIVVIFALFLLIGAVSYQIYQSEAQRSVVAENFQELKARADELGRENEKIKEDIGYYSNETNLEKEARSQFNYRKSDEKMIIVVPEKDPTLR